MKQTFLHLLVSLSFVSICGAEFQINTRTSLDQADPTIRWRNGGTTTRATGRHPPAPGRPLMPTAHALAQPRARSHQRTRAAATWGRELRNTCLLSALPCQL